MEYIIQTLTKKYARRVLTRLEDNKLITPAIRKIVLDGFNDLNRELLSKLVVKP